MGYCWFAASVLDARGKTESSAVIGACCPVERAGGQQFLLFLVHTKSRRKRHKGRETCSREKQGAEQAGRSCCREPAA